MYSQLSTSCASKISINLMAQNLLIESWYNLHLLSISSTFYDQLLCRYSCAKKFPSQTVTREKLRAIHFLTKKACIKCWWNWHLIYDSSPIASIAVESRRGPNSDRLAPLRRGLLWIHFWWLIADAAECHAQDGLGHLSGEKTSINSTERVTDLDKLK